MHLEISLFYVITFFEECRGRKLSYLLFDSPEISQSVEKNGVTGGSLEFELLLVCRTNSSLWIIEWTFSREIEEWVCCIAQPGELQSIETSTYIKSESLLILSETILWFRVRRYLLLQPRMKILSLSFSKKLREWGAYPVSFNDSVVIAASRMYCWKSRATTT